MTNSTSTGNGTQVYLAPTLLCAGVPTLSLILIILLLCFAPRKIHPRPVPSETCPSDGCQLSRLRQRRPEIEHHGLWLVAPKEKKVAQVATQTMEAPLEDQKTQTC